LSKKQFQETIFPPTFQINPDLEADIDRKDPASTAVVRLILMMEPVGSNSWGSTHGGPDIIDILARYPLETPNRETNR